MPFFCQEYFWTFFIRAHSNNNRYANPSPVPSYSSVLHTTPSRNLNNKLPQQQATFAYFTVVILSPRRIPLLRIRSNRMSF